MRTFLRQLTNSHNWTPIIIVCVALYRKPSRIRSHKSMLLRGGHGLRDVTVSPESLAILVGPRVGARSKGDVELFRKQVD